MGKREVVYEKISNENLKKLHQVEVEILDEIVRICKKHKLNYYLVGGTLIGAIRHKGFIPWDDDLDISMPREDYEKFLEVAPLELNEKYYLENRKYNEKFHLPFTKIKKNNTEFREIFTSKLDNHKGIFVDIFPLDNIKNPSNFLTKIRSIIIKNTVQAVFVKLKLQKLNECRRPFLCALYQPFSVKTMYKFQRFLMTKDNKIETKYLCNFCGQYSIWKETFDRKMLTPVKVPFEDKKYNTFKYYDEYLRHIYGDYMKLPPEEDRVNHSPSNIDFTHGKNIKMKDVLGGK